MQDYGFRLYNPSIGKFLSVDPLRSDYPMLTTYQFASNSPISGIDLDGLEYYFSANGILLGKYGESSEIRIMTKKGVSKNVNTQMKLYVANKVAKDKGENEGTKFLIESLNKNSISFTEFKIRTKKNKRVGENIMTYFYKKLNPSTEKGMVNFVQDGIHAMTTDAYGHGKRVIVFGLKERQKTFFNSEMAKTANNLQNTMVHERYHLMNHENVEVGSDKGDGSDLPEIDHLDAYYAQVNHKTWEGTTLKYKKDTYEFMLGYINNMSNEQYKKNQKDKIEKTFKKYKKKWKDL